MKRLSVIVVVAILSATSAVSQELKPRLAASPNDPNGTILEYNPSNGDFRFYLLPEATRAMTTIEIVSESAIFDGPGAPCRFVGLFDIYTPRKLFKLDPAGFSDFTCEGAAQTDLTLNFLTEDLTVSGSLAGGGSLTDVVFLVPEPSSVGLFLSGLALFVLKVLRTTE